MNASDFEFHEEIIPSQKSSPNIPLQTEMHSERREKPLMKGFSRYAFVLAIVVFFGGLFAGGLFHTSDTTPHGTFSQKILNNKPLHSSAPPQKNKDIEKCVSTALPLFLHSQNTADVMKCFKK